VSSSSRRFVSASKLPPPAVMVCIWVFLGLFLIAGLGVVYFLTVRPLFQVIAARKWEQTPCIVDSSQVAAVLHTSNDTGGSTRPVDRTTYRIEVVYHYDFRGQRYTSDRYQFAVGSTGGFLPKQRIVEQYPPGTHTFCYVNPEAPAEAVIDRGMYGGMALGLSGLVFVFVGGGGLAAVGRAVRSAKIQDSRTK
jgi:hypothetical protein